MSCAPKLLMRIQLSLTYVAHSRTLRYGVIYQDESLRLKPLLPVSRCGTLRIVSSINPALIGDKIFIRGLNRDRDYHTDLISEEQVRKIGFPRFKNLEEYVDEMLSAFSVLGSVQGRLVPDDVCCLFDVWERQNEEAVSAV